jgi:hypothetical protein
MITKKSFIDGIISDVTMDVLPFNLPLKRVISIIDKSISTWRDRDDRATREDILFIETKNSNCKIIKLPEDIKAITRLEIVSGGGSMGFFYSSEGRTMISSSGGMGEDGLLSYVTTAAYSEILKSISVRFIPYDFSEYTHELILQGDVNSRNIFCEVARYIAPESLYKIDDFESYVAAKVTIDYCKVNNFFGKKLVGGREINFDSLKEDAEDFLKEIKERWDEQGKDGILLMD